MPAIAHSAIPIDGRPLLRVRTVLAGLGVVTLLATWLTLEYAPRAKGVYILAATMAAFIQLATIIIAARFGRPFPGGVLGAVFGTAAATGIVAWLHDGERDGLLWVVFGISLGVTLTCGVYLGAMGKMTFAMLGRKPPMPRRARIWFAARKHATFLAVVGLVVGFVMSAIWAAFSNSLIWGNHDDLRFFAWSIGAAILMSIAGMVAGGLVSAILGSLFAAIFYDTRLLPPEADRPQFGLRSMMIGTGFVSALLALGQVYLMPDYVHYFAWKKLTNAGAKVVVESSDSQSFRGHARRFERPIAVYLLANDLNDENIAAINAFPHLEMLAVLGPLRSGDALSRLVEVPGLTHLWIGSHGPLTPSDLAPLSQLTQLRRLSLFLSKPTDDALVHLSGLTNLTNLDLTLTGISDAGLVHLSNLTSLTELKLWSTNVTPAGVAALRAKLPELKITP